MLTIVSPVIPHVMPIISSAQHADAPLPLWMNITFTIVFSACMLAVSIAMLLMIAYIVFDLDADKFTAWRKSRQERRHKRHMAHLKRRYLHYQSAIKYYDRKKKLLAEQVGDELVGGE